MENRRAISVGTAAISATIIATETAKFELNHSVIPFYSASTLMRLNLEQLYIN